MKMKHLMLAAAVFVVATPGMASAANYTLNLGTVLAPTDPLMVAAQGMKKAVEERTKGEVEIRLFPSSQMGDTQDMMDQAQAGSNVGTFAEASRLAVHVPQFNALVAPYVFNSVDDIARFAETPTFAKWTEALKAKTGLNVVSFNWYQGARQMVTKKQVRTPADLKGLRIRTIGEPLWVKTVTLMGGTATPMAFAEVYPSIQTGALDGAEVQPAAIWGAKLHEVATHITLTEHIYLMSGLIISDKWLQSLPAGHRQIVMEEAKRWGASAMKTNVEGATKIFEDIKAKGVKVESIDTKPFRDAVKPIYEELKLTDHVNEVLAALKK